MGTEGDGMTCGMPRLATVVWLTIGAFTLGAFLTGLGLVAWAWKG